MAAVAAAATAAAASSLSTSSHLDRPEPSKMLQPWVSKTGGGPGDAGLPRMVWLIAEAIYR